IASDVSGNREIVQDQVTGYIVPANNSEALSEKILSVLKNIEQARSLAKWPTMGHRTRDAGADGRTTPPALSISLVKCAESAASSNLTANPFPTPPSPG